MANVARKERARAQQERELHARRSLETSPQTFRTQDSQSFTAFGAQGITWNVPQSGVPELVQYVNVSLPPLQRTRFGNEGVTFSVARNEEAIRWTSMIVQRLIRSMQVIVGGEIWYDSATDPFWGLRDYDSYFSSPSNIGLNDMVGMNRTLDSRPGNLGQLVSTGTPDPFLTQSAYLGPSASSSILLDSGFWQQPSRSLQFHAVECLQEKDDEESWALAQKVCFEVGSNCVVCLEPLQHKRLCMLPCKHSELCESCWHRMKEESMRVCPLCRGEICVIVYVPIDALESQRC